MTFRPKANSCSTVLSLALIFFVLIVPSTSHGFMSSPRSRNLCAFEKDHLLFGGPNAPEAENCPHCLNLGGTLARCGITADRNYDLPQNTRGDPMPVNIQASYQEGEEIVIESKLTAHHRGHFSVKACPIKQGEVPTQKCFDSHPLTFVKDLLYGAKPDKNYPGRAYVAPSNHKGKRMDRKGVSGMMFRHKYRLPDGLHGDLVLLQWHYLTANSCNPEGYDEYDWPKGKRTTWYKRTLPVCKNIPSDGRGVPEQFWNCAEVSIRPRNERIQDDSDNNSGESSDEPETEQPTKYTNDGSGSNSEDGVNGNEDTYSDAFFCGSSRKEVKKKACKNPQALKPCPTGQNGECPHRQKCYEASDCATRNEGRSNHFFCGTSWWDASQKCSSRNAIHCPKGRDSDCPSKQKCWADMPCDSTEDRGRALYLRGHTT